MVNEHAVTYSGLLTTEDLSYLVKKANQLGLKERKIHRVFLQEDNEGTHVYFEVDSMKERE